MLARAHLSSGVSYPVENYIRVIHFSTHLWLALWKITRMSFAARVSELCLASGRVLQLLPPHGHKETHKHEANTDKEVDVAVSKARDGETASGDVSNDDND